MPVIKFLGSIKFAIVLITALAVILAISTLLESIHGTPLAQKIFYRAGWFDLFLSLLWVNIFCSTLTRMPFKKHHTGFVVTHTGILLLLIGALLSRLLGIEGQMTLFEGEHRGHIVQADETQEEFSIREGSDQNPLNRAVQVSLVSEAMGFNHTFWLIEKDPQNPHSSFTSMGPAFIELRTNPVSQTDVSTLRLFKNSGELLYSTSLGEEMPKELTINDTDLKLANLRYFPHAKVVNNQIVNLPDEVRFNPAVEFEVYDSLGHRERHTRFFLFPQFESLQGGTSRNVFDLSVDLQVPIPEEFQESKSPSLTFSLSSDQQWRYRIKSSKGSAAEGVIELNKTVPTGWMDIQFRVDQIYNRAIPSTVGSKSTQAPFILQLVDFRKIDYPGTQNPAAYESDVILYDPKKKITIERTISMNHPLDYAGYRIFQASYMQDPVRGEGSVFTVAKNPGIPLIYGGAVILFTGVILLFYIKPFSRESSEQPK